jgi:hypothetical protein
MENIALNAVVEERKKQDIKWGIQDHDAGKWILILQEEIGEFSQRTLDNQFSNNDIGCPFTRDELVQVASVALAMLESYDRGYCR